MKSVNFKEVSNVPFLPDWSRDKEITDLSERKRDTVKFYWSRVRYDCGCDDLYKLFSVSWGNYIVTSDYA